MDQIVERFKSGDLGPIATAARISLPVDSPAARWSFGNRALVAAQTGTPDCRGYRQWQAAGRQVTEKGAAYIFRPQVIKDKETGEERFIGRYSTVPVHPYNHTKPIEGFGGEVLDYTPKELPPLMEVAKRFGLKVEFMPTGDDFLGFYHDSKSMLVVGTDNWGTFFHELGHAGHYRVNPEIEMGTKDKAHKEAIAELTACVLMDMYGHDRTRNTWHYIEMFNPDDPIGAIMKASKEVGKILDLVFEEVA